MICERQNETDECSDTKHQGAGIPNVMRSTYLLLEVTFQSRLFNQPEEERVELGSRQRKQHIKGPMSGKGGTRVALECCAVRLRR